eukprot:1894967-Amphidinium_carterae.1
MITDIYAEYEKKPRAQPPWQHRFLLLMIQHHSTKTTKIMQDAGLSAAQINQVYDYFDEKAPQHFSRPNVRNLTEIQHLQHLSRLRPRREAEAQHDGYSDIEEE